MAKSWTMTAEHAAHAAKFPPREGYTCGSHAETYGGGCFNCGWNPESVTVCAVCGEESGARGSSMYGSVHKYGPTDHDFTPKASA